METRDLRCALTQPYASTSRAFTVAVRLWSPSEKMLVTACSVFLVLLNDVYIRVNCIMVNQLIFSTEQRVFIYDICVNSVCQPSKKTL